MRVAHTLFLPVTIWFLAAGCDLTRAPLMDEALLGTAWQVDKLWTPEETIIPGLDTTMIVHFLDDWDVGASTHRATISAASMPCWGDGHCP